MATPSIILKPIKTEKPELLLTCELLTQNWLDIQPSELPLLCLDLSSHPSVPALPAYEWPTYSWKKCEIPFITQKIK